VAAAIAAVRSGGAGVGMDDIAAQAGTSKPVVYRYFTDKSDLYAAVGQRVGADLVSAVTATMDETPDPAELIHRVVDRYLTLIEQDPELYRFVVRRPLLDRPAERDPVADYSTIVATHLAAIIGDQLRAAGLDSGAAEPWAFGLVGLVRTAGEWWLDHRSLSRSALTTYLTSLISRGVLGASGLE
jgi:AcrR family transcriptional regulator